MTTRTTATDATPESHELERARASWRTAESLALSAEARDELLAGHLAYTLSGPDGGASDAGYGIENGVALVTIEGALMSDGCRWWDGYETIAARVAHAHANGAVRAVLVTITSPGGMVAGMLDGMRALRAAKAKSGKRMVAWVPRGAYSAAYGLASTCDEIVVEELAGVGSVGVIDGMCSRIEEARRAGLDVRVIASGVEKTDCHPYVEISPEAEGRKRERVMAQANAFVREIALGRPSLAPEAALALDGGVRFGAAAVADRLADRISTRAALLAELAAVKAPSTPSGPRGSASTDTPTRNPMIDEKLAALIAARTKETDPERQLGALTAVFDAAARTPALEAQLHARELAEKTAAEARALAEREAAEKAAKAQKDAAFATAVKAGQDGGKLTPAEAERWLAQYDAGEVSLGVLEGNLAIRAPLPALSQEHKDLRPPAAPPTGGGLKPRLAELAARPYGALDLNERNELATGAPDTHDRIYRAWVADGRPKPVAR